MKTKQFLEKFKIQKALGDYKKSLSFGDKLTMYNCSYKVLKSDEQYTLLEDEKNIKMAIPTDKLQLLMKTGQAQNSGLVNFIKSFKDNLNKGATPGMSKPSSGATQPASNPNQHGQPIGTVSRGADGEMYKKVSSNPAKWVHVTEGSSHTNPGEKADDHMAHPENQKAFIQIRNKVMSNTHPEDHPKLEKLLKDYMAQKAKIKNLRDAHNVGEVGKDGKPISAKQTTRSFHVSRFAAMEERADGLKRRFLDAVKASKARPDLKDGQKSAAKMQQKGEGEGSHITPSQDELQHALDKGKMAIVSAGKNPKDAKEKDMTPEQQEARHQELLKYLRKEGYKFTEAKGNYDGEEKSIHVHNMSEHDAAKLGEKFNQDSVIHVDKGEQKMIYTTGENKGKHHKGKGWKEAQGAKNYYTELKTRDGKKFKYALNFDFDKLHD